MSNVKMPNDQGKIEPGKVTKYRFVYFVPRKVAIKLRDQQAIDALKVRLTREKAEELVKAGKRVGIIAREYGAHHKTVGAVLLEYGLTYEGVKVQVGEKNPVLAKPTPVKTNKVADDVGRGLLPVHLEGQKVMMQVRGVYEANSLADILDTLATTVTGIRLPKQKYAVVLDIVGVQEGDGSDERTGG